jgi:hypothetical protein
MILLLNLIQNISNSSSTVSVQASGDLFGSWKHMANISGFIQCPTSSTKHASYDNMYTATISDDKSDFSKMCTWHITNNSFKLIHETQIPAPESRLYHLWWPQCATYMNKTNFIGVLHSADRQHIEIRTWSIYGGISTVLTTTAKWGYSVLSWARGVFNNNYYYAIVAHADDASPILLRYDPITNNVSLTALDFSFSPLNGLSKYGANLVGWCNQSPCIIYQNTTVVQGSYTFDDYYLLGQYVVINDAYYSLANISNMQMWLKTELPNLKTKIVGITNVNYCGLAAINV